MNERMDEVSLKDDGEVAKQKNLEVCLMGGLFMRLMKTARPRNGPGGIVEFALGLCLAASPVGAAQGPLYGFSPGESEKQLKLESAFRALPDAENLRQYMQRLSARPHHVGSPYDKENAEWIHQQMTAWGWDSSIEKFEVLFPTPKTRVLEMTEPVQFTAGLREKALPVDSTSGQSMEQLPTYNAYSRDGDVNGLLVYVNYGLPEDYKELARLGVSVKGALVIAKYGKSWRGIKPKVAAEKGAIGCILYSDRQNPTRRRASLRGEASLLASRGLGGPVHWEFRPPSPNLASSGFQGHSWTHDCN